MTRNRPKVLMIMEQCNPDWASVPLEGYNYFHEVSQVADVTLVTHIRNRPAIEKRAETADIHYIDENPLIAKYHDGIEKLVNNSKKVIWQLYHLLTYPTYAEFNHRVYKQFGPRIRAGEFDIVHALTPMMPRYPVKAVQACAAAKVPFVLGPVNGGVPFPAGFQEKAKKEYVGLNFLRAVGRFLVPGYRATYTKADRVLAGSTYTHDMVRDMFNLSSERLHLFYENGIPDSFVAPTRTAKSDDRVNLLFVGRLVPYKCADIVLEAIAQLAPDVRRRVHLEIVGTGPEQPILEARTAELGLQQQVHFAGWVTQAETLEYYRQADIFCFPSIREFGGAVVLEAMACGLPCIVANNGGIGEYVTPATGYSIDPLSREYLTQQVAEKITTLVTDPDLRRTMAAQGIERVKVFRWRQKGQQMLDMYQSLLARSAPTPTASPVANISSKIQVGA
jgi:glycosyltransferase involved in cell wall biosynthesis